MINNNLEQVIEVPNCNGPSVTLKCLIDIVNEMPEQHYLYKGIKVPSMGAIFGVPKAGKTILAESLGLSVAAGLNEFLGEKIYSGNQRVMFFGLEEYYPSRTKRNEKQIEYFTKAYDLPANWTENIFVVNEDFPKHILSDDDWKLLDQEIERIKPTMVMIDSLTRLTLDPIEDSTVASKLMKKLKELTHKHNIALVLIHHTHKMENRPITLATLAGSRVIGQELDFMIGVNKTNRNDRYIKDVAYRYANDDLDYVTTFEINDYLVIEQLKQEKEYKLLEGAEVSANQNPNDQSLIQYFLEYAEGDNSVIIETKQLKDHFVNPGFMSGPTLYATLKRLINQNVIWQPEKGKYALRESS